MAVISFKKDKRWQAFQRALDSGRFRAIAQKHMQQGMGKAGKYLERQIRGGIQGKAFKPVNAELTIAIKGTSVGPLVDSSMLFNAIRSHLQSWNLCFVGVLRQEDAYNIGRTVHDGVTIPVTAKMRGMFWALWLKSIGRSVVLEGRAVELWERMPGGWKPLNDSTTSIVIPPRPFVEKVMEDERVKARVRMFWRAAMNATFKEIASGGQA